MSFYLCFSRGATIHRNRLIQLCKDYVGVFAIEMHSMRMCSIFAGNEISNGSLKYANNHMEDAEIGLV